MRRVHLRGRNNLLKRLLVHAAAFNISLLLRKTLGAGKPRQFQGLSAQLLGFVLRLAGLLLTYSNRVVQQIDDFTTSDRDSRFDRTGADHLARGGFK